MLGFCAQQEADAFTEDLQLAKDGFAARLVLDGDPAQVAQKLLVKPTEPIAKLLDECVKLADRLEWRRARFHGLPFASSRVRRLGCVG